MITKEALSSRKVAALKDRVLDAIRLKGGSYSRDRVMAVNMQLDKLSTLQEKQHYLESVLTEARR